MWLKHVRENQLQQELREKIEFRCTTGGDVHSLCLPAFCGGCSCWCVIYLTQSGRFGCCVASVSQITWL